jgi:hypothetical protein
MEIVTKSGQVSTTGTKILKASAFNKEKIEVRLIKFFNSSPYELTLKRVNEKINKTVILYTFTLDAEDSVFDTTPYSLIEGEYLLAECNVSGTTYLIEGNIL